MGSLRDRTFENELIRHFLLRSDELSEFWENKHSRDPFHKSLAPFDKNPTNCGGIIEGLPILNYPLNFAVS